MMTDPIADLLSRIRNASMARHELTRVPANKLKKNIALLLKAEGYVADVRQEEWGPQKHQTLTIVLKYGEDRTSAFQGIRRVSRPGSPRVRASRSDPARPQRPRHLDHQHLHRSDVRQGSASPQSRWRAPV